MSMNFVGPNLVRIDQDDPVVFLAGVHVGCFEVFGGERVAMPSAADAMERRREITTQELAALLSGIDLQQASRRKRYRR